ncbi:MAG: zinc-ribbon domain-containing protein [Myxococcales bacterium]|nr:zinc-ribbon domain-containing protein [Myxococcales bacterium]
MKFLCNHCKAKYQIADEKVAGRTLRMTCRQCQGEIVIRGDQPGAATAYQSLSGAGMAPAVDVLGAGFNQQLSAQAMPAVAPASHAGAAQWHVAINDVPVGPMSRHEVAAKIAAGAVDAESLAWREGLDDWLPVRHLPELSGLLTQAAAASQQIAALAPPPPIQSLMPEQRAAAAAPIGGRGGLVPSYGPEEWAAPPLETNPSQVTHNPLMEPTGRSQPNMALIFALFGGFAFLMSAMAIFGARMLRDDPQPPPAPIAEATPEAPPPTLELEDQAPEEPEQEVEEMVIGLEDVEHESAPQRSGTRKPKEGGNKKQLTEAQKAMLARMGGGLDEEIGKLNTAGGSGSNRRKAGSGELTAAQISKVVLRGKRNLQRCYETAVRSSGSDDTIRLDVVLTVAESGNVKSVKVKGQGLPGMSRCIERTVRGWRFPASGSESQPQFPLVFQPGG